VLAEVLGTPFITTDRRLARALRGTDANALFLGARSHV